MLRLINGCRTLAPIVCTAKALWIFLGKIKMSEGELQLPLLTKQSQHMNVPEEEMNSLMSEWCRAHVRGIMVDRLLHFQPQERGALQPWRRGLQTLKLFLCHGNICRGENTKRSGLFAHSWQNHVCLFNIAGNMCRQWVNMDLFSGPNTYTNDSGRVPFFFFNKTHCAVCTVSCLLWMPSFTPRKETNKISMCWLKWLK